MTGETFWRISDTGYLERKKTKQTIVFCILCVEKENSRKFN